MRDTQRGVAKVDPCLSRSKRPLKSIVSSTSVQVQVFRVATPSESEGHHVGTETKRHKKCALGKSRKSGDCKRMWHKEWELEYLEVTTAKMQYSAYRNDGYQFNSNKRPDMFFHQLSKVPEYSQFGLLSLTLL